MNPPLPISVPATYRIDAAAITSRGELPRASLILNVHDARATIEAIAPTHELAASSRFAHAHVIDRSRSLLIPGLINAHTHLDLTHIGPRPFDAAQGFVGFVDLVRRERAILDDDIAASVREGARLSLAGGIVAVGDIAGAPKGHPSLIPWREASRQGLHGVSFVEFFSIGRFDGAWRERVTPLLESARRDSPGLSLGLQPHATNTVSVAAYLDAVALAKRLDLPLCTHLAETIEEREFLAAARGPQRDLLVRLNAWDDSILQGPHAPGRGLSPVQHLAPVLAAARFACAHVNDASDADLGTLAASGASVVYCPRASDYFRAHETLGPHRYRNMLAAGIPVALGTDSIINLPPLPRGKFRVGSGDGFSSSAPSRLSTWDDMAFLHRRDATPALTLLDMATIHAARAIHMDPDAFILKEGASPLGLASVSVHGQTLDSLDLALEADADIEMLFLSRSRA